MVRKMKAVFFLLFAGIASLHAQVDSFIDQPKDWSSWQEVISASLEARTVARGAGKDQAITVDAIWYGLRSVEYVWKLDVKDPSRLSLGEDGLLLAIASRRTLREIAVFGILLTLAETRHLGNESEIAGNFRVDEFSHEVLARRTQALEYLAVLLRKAEPKADASKHSRPVSNP